LPYSSIALIYRNEVWPALGGDVVHEISDRRFRWAVVPGRQRVGRACADLARSDAFQKFMRELLHYDRQAPLLLTCSGT
jgi:hypothetical protein